MSTKPFHFTLEDPGHPNGGEKRPQDNHRPNAYARLSTVHRHLQDHKRACAKYADHAQIFRIYENGVLLETHHIEPAPLET